MTSTTRRRHKYEQKYNSESRRTEAYAKNKMCVADEQKKQRNLRKISKKKIKKEWKTVLMTFKNPSRAT